MRKLLAVLFTAALVMMASVSVSWGNEASPDMLGGTWESIDELLGTWE